jgi:hypothetical protein
MLIMLTMEGECMRSPAAGHPDTLISFQADLSIRTNPCGSLLIVKELVESRMPVVFLFGLRHLSASLSQAIIRIPAVLRFSFGSLLRCFGLRPEPRYFGKQLRLAPARSYAAAVCDPLDIFHYCSSIPGIRLTTAKEGSLADSRDTADVSGAS